MEDLRQTGTVESCMDRLKMSKKIPASQHVLRVLPDTLSGPVALLVLILFREEVTWSCRIRG